jgi:hypothetical protein
MSQTEPENVGHREYPPFGVGRLSYAGMGSVTPVSGRLLVWA